MKCLNCNKSISLSTKVAYLLLGKKAQTCSPECEKILDLQLKIPQEEQIPLPKVPHSSESSIAFRHYENGCVSKLLNIGGASLSDNICILPISLKQNVSTERKIKPGKMILCKRTVKGGKELIIPICHRCSRKLPRNRKEYCCWKCRYPDSNHAISKAKRYCQTRTCSTVIPMDATYVYCRACETKREKKRKKNAKESALKNFKPRNYREKKSSPLVKVPLKKEKCLHVKKLKFDLPPNVNDWSKWPTEKKLKAVSKEFQESIWSR